MGLTINYDIKFQGTQTDLVNKLSKVRNLCLDKPFESVGEIKPIIITKEIIDRYNYLQEITSYPDNSDENLRKRDEELLELGVSIDLMINLDVNEKLTPDRQFVIFNVWAGNGCEDTEFYFAKNKTNNKWYASGFTKTQFAEHFIRCHLLVIYVLDMLKESGFDVDVRDEGEYYETRDLEVLAKNINDYTGLLLQISGELKEQVKNSEFTLDCEIDKSANIVDINPDS